MSSIAISVSRLVKSFSAGSAGAGRREAFHVLGGIDLEVASGEILGLLGANGAGKTTLMEILAAHLLPTSGEVRICGHDVVREAALVRRLIGYAPSSQDTFFPRLSACQNLEFFATLYDLDRAATTRRIDKLLTLVGLEQARHTSFQKLSLGMQQRLAIARALLADPPVLLLDEPTRSLDPAMRREIHRLLVETLRAQQGKTILLVTHSFHEAEEVCNRVAILSRGRVVGCGSVAELLASTHAANLADAFAQLAGHDIASAESPDAQPAGRLA